MIKKLALLAYLLAVLAVPFSGNLEVSASHCGALGGPDREACEAGHATAESAGIGCELNKNILGIPTWYKYLPTENDSTGRCSPVIPETRAALPIGIAILEAMLRLAGLVAVVMVFLGSFKYILSRGDGDQAKDAKNTVVNALIGLIIVIISSSVVSFLGNRLG